MAGKIMNRSQSEKMFLEAKKLMPGGVSSPVRAFGSVGGHPVFFERASGSHLWDVDGNRYIDYVGSWGPAILGHSHPEILEAVFAAAKKGLSFGAPTPGETKLAQLLVDALPAMEMVRFVSSGTEACMSAIRLARGFTKRDKIIKFTGNYHGHGDMLLVKAGSGVATFGLPDSLGVPEGAAMHTLVAPYNDLDAVRRLLEANPKQVACIIVEPIVGNAGFIRPNSDFLPGLRELTSQHGALFIMDEVMTGFRVAWGGAQNLYDLRPDLSTFGKVIGGGMPLAAYGGRRDIMSLVAPIGPVYQAGTLSGNPVAVACGIKTLELLKKPGIYDSLGNMTKNLVSGFEKLARQYRIPFITDSEGGMFGFFFGSTKVTNFEDAKAMGTDQFNRFHKGMLDQGIYLAPSAFEAGFVSLAHSQQDIDETLAAAEKTFKDLTRA
jgi:glutamate-1-semialdehyde 2,1-aminomutase